MTITLGKYVAQRVKQLGVKHIFGLPGDFNLPLVDEILEADNLVWVGNANELNAGYAADAYARAEKQLGVLLTTYGVGELSAVNAIAGSYAERGPVLHIVGTPPLSQVNKAKPLHHTMQDGDFGHYARIFEEVTVAGMLITDVEASNPQKLVDEVDRIIMEILRHSRPGYLGIPLDLVKLEVPDVNLQNPIKYPKALPAVAGQFERDLRLQLEYLANTKGEKFTILAGMLNYRRDTMNKILQIADTGKVNIAFQPNARTILTPDHPANVGVYAGGITKDRHVQELVDNANPLILVGAVLGEWNLGQFTQRFNEDYAIELNLNYARIGVARYDAIPLEKSVKILRNVINSLDTKLEDPPALLNTFAKGAEVSSGELNQCTFWEEIEQFLKSAPYHDVVISDMGTSIFGLLSMDFPAQSDFLTQNLWASIGYALPATLGISLAMPGSRPVLFTGDGSAQLTIQELSTMKRHNVRPVIFLLDNDGYTIERAIMKPTAQYHDISKWDWNSVAAGLYPGIKTYDISNLEELTSALDLVNEDVSTAHFVRVHLDQLDLPPLMKRFFGKEM